MTTARLVVGMVVTAAGLTACGGQDGGGGATAIPAGTSAAQTSAAETSAAAPAGGEAILIETRITDARSHRGEVVDGSVLGEAAFCAGGTTSGSSLGRTITTVFTCPDGTLEVRFAPTQPSLVQGSLWEVASGTGAYEGLQGGGSMVASFLGDDPDTGREVFAGTVGT